MTRRNTLTAQALLHDARAPRYTSYPPATQFGPEIGPANFADWIMRIPDGAEISLYLHIPFCRRLCWFCACRTQGTLSGAPLGPYLETLIQEMDLVANVLAPGVKVAHLHLGGGTPTLLNADLTARLFEALHQRFDLTEGAEVSVELDPTEIDDARLDALAAGGLTRASLGVQDFEPAVQAAIGRRQSVAQTRFAVEGLRVRGVDSLNFDLLYGLPCQTSDTLSRTLDQVVELGPDRLALYGYAHVPWAAKRQVMIPTEALPDGPLRLSLFTQAEARLKRAGYVSIGIDHFAKPADAMARAARAGTLRRNFQGYTTDRAEALVGLGASAISRFREGYAQNSVRTGVWSAAIGEGIFATARGHALSADDRLRGSVIDRLMCDFIIRPGDWPDAQAVDRMARAAARAWPDALIVQPGGSWAIPPEARHLARLVAMGFDAYTEADTSRHSRAI